MEKIINSILYLHKKKILIFLPVIGVIPALISLLYTTHTVFPSEKHNKRFAYSDTTGYEKEKTGASVVTEFSADSLSIRFSYTLKKGYEYPYTGFNISLLKDSQYLDISRFDYLRLVLSPCNSRALRVVLRTYIDNFTDLKDYNTYRFLSTELDLVPQQQEYIIDISDIKTALWWYQTNGMTESELGRPDIKKVIDMEFENGELSPLDTIQSLIFHSIELKKDMTVTYALSFGGVFLYFLLYFLILRLTKKAAPPVIIPYTKIDVGNYADQEVKKIVETIATRYSDQNLSLHNLSKEIGISPTKASELLQKKFNLSFKQYLNNIRLAESQRLLRDTDRQVSEIAYAVGYTSVTHFHRVFKQVFDQSPNEYRKIVKKE